MSGHHGMGMGSEYTPPLGLTIISSISIGIAGLVALWIMFDIIWRRGWKTMMWIMIPVYIINALYLWPLTLWTYLKFGRPAKPGSKEAGGSHEMNHGSDPEHTAHMAGHDHTGHEMPPPAPAKDETAVGGAAVAEGHDHLEHGDATHDHHGPPPKEKEQHEHHDSAVAPPPKAPAGGHAHMHGGGDLPMFANVTIAVCHCGAGCVLGDIIGEWIVYGTGTTIGGRDIWPEWIIDFVLALFFGIFFQYFSIAPATGEYGLKTVWRATTADFFSLVAFEIGLFGWMAIFEIAIFKWMLEMNTVTYWFMMQIGMFCGHWTAVPINWWLLVSNIKVAIH